MVSQLVMDDVKQFYRRFGKYGLRAVVRVFDVDGVRCVAGPADLNSGIALAGSMDDVFAILSERDWKSLAEALQRKNILLRESVFLLIPWIRQTGLVVCPDDRHVYLFEDVDDLRVPARAYRDMPHLVVDDVSEARGFIEEWSRGDRSVRYLPALGHHDVTKPHCRYDFAGFTKAIWVDWNDRLHRVDGPSQLLYRPDGTLWRAMFAEKGLCHRANGPAKLYYKADGVTVCASYWYKRGKRVRVVRDALWRS